MAREIQAGGVTLVQDANGNWVPKQAAVSEYQRALESTIPGTNAPSTWGMYAGTGVDPGDTGFGAGLQRMTDYERALYEKLARPESAIDTDSYLDRAGDQEAIARAQGAYGRQSGALDMAQQAALGNAPSAAEIQGRRQLDQAMQQNIGLARSGGGAGGMRAALYANAKAGAGASADAAALRAQEMAAARGQYMQGTQGLSSTAAGMRSQVFERGRMGIQAEDVARGRSFQREQAGAAGQSGINQRLTSVASHGQDVRNTKGESAKQMGLQIGGAATSAIAPVVGAWANPGSDPLVKQNIFPAGIQPSGIDMKTGITPAGQMSAADMFGGGGGVSGFMRNRAEGVTALNGKSPFDTAPGWEAPQNQKDILRDSLTKAGPDMNEVALAASASPKAEGMANQFAKAAFNPMGKSLEALSASKSPQSWIASGGKGPIKQWEEAGKAWASPEKYLDAKGLIPTEKDALKAGQAILGQAGPSGNVAGALLPSLAAGEMPKPEEALGALPQMAPDIAKAVNPMAGTGQALGAQTANAQMAGQAANVAGQTALGGASAGLGAAAPALAAAGPIGGAILGLGKLFDLSDPAAKMGVQPANFPQRITSAIDAKSGLLPAGLELPWGPNKSQSLGGPASIKTGIQPAQGPLIINPAVPPSVLQSTALHRRGGGPIGYNPIQSGDISTIGSGMQTGYRPEGIPGMTAQLTNTGPNQYAGTATDAEFWAAVRDSNAKDKQKRNEREDRLAKMDLDDKLATQAKPQAMSEEQLQSLLDKNESLNKENIADQSKQESKESAKAGAQQQDKDKYGIGAAGSNFGKILASYRPFDIAPLQLGPSAVGPVSSFGAPVQGNWSDPETKQGKSEANSPIRDFEEKAKGFTYQYKSPEFEDGTAPPGSTHMGPMADALRDVKGGIGETLTYEDPQTGLLGVNSGRLGLATAAAVNDLHERIKELEARKRGGKK